MSTTTFGVWDYMVFGSMLVASVCIGIYHAVRGKNMTTMDYLVAGRSMTFLPVALSLVATLQSSITMLGMPAESYVYGFSWFLGELCCSMGNILEFILTLAFIYRLDLSTPFEFFERRFKSRGLRVLTNVVACGKIIFIAGMVMYGQAIALQAVTGFSMFGSIIVTASVAVFYTAIGGLKAVIWTDVLQFLIMFTGFIAVSVKGTVDAGGAGEVWTRAAQSGRLDLSLDPDPSVRHTVWNLCFGGILSGFGLVFMPATLQRLSSTKSLTEFRRALLLAIFVHTLLIGIALAEGTVAFGYYSYKRCDPLASKQIKSPNQIIPFMITDLFQHWPGLPGLFLAALASASLSTLSSCLSALSVITWYDLFKPCLSNTSDFRGLLTTKITVVIFGVLGCMVAVLISLIGSRTLHQVMMTFLACFDTPVTGLFYLGALFPFVNTKGAITGFATGVVFMAWLVLGSMFSSSGDHAPYYPLGPNDQCPAFNLSLVNMKPVNIDMSTPLQYDISTTLQYNISTTSGYIATKTKSGLELLYSLSYTLYSSVAACIVLLVGTATSLMTGGWRNRADPELVIHMADIPFGCLRRRQRLYVSNNTHDNTEVEAEHVLMADCLQQTTDTVPNTTSCLGLADRT